jgi:hypothetical protein
MSIFNELSDSDLYLLFIRTGLISRSEIEQRLLDSRNIDDYKSEDNEISKIFFYFKYPARNPKCQDYF